MAAPFDVVVAGAGIGGLACALALHKQGFRVCVLERASGAQAEGAGIQLGPNACKTLSKLDLFNLVAEKASRVEQIHVRDGVNGRTLTHLPVGDFIMARHGAPHMVIHRADLHDVLTAQAKKANRIDLIYGQAVTACQTDPQGIAVTCDTGAEFKARILVGADGVFSNIRQLLLRDGPPRPSGLVAWRALIEPELAPPAAREHATGLWMTPNRHLVHYRVRGGSLLNLVAMTEGSAEIRGWSHPGDKTALAREFSRATEPVRSLIDSTDQWFTWPLFDRPRASRYSAGRIALLGDAAHPTLPCLAQGGAMAIEDAYILARCLKANIKSPDKALQRYDQLRLERTARLQQASRNTAKIYHLGGPARWARNITLRTNQRRAPEKTLTRYDWLYGYDPTALDFNAENSGQK